MNNERYNGWANRATWVVNLHYGDREEWLQEMVDLAEGDVEQLASFLQEEISNQVHEVIGHDAFISDLVNLSEIDWWELAQHYYDDYWQEDDEVEMICPNCGMTSTFLQSEIGQFVCCDCCESGTILITQEEFDKRVAAGEIHPDDFEN